MNHHISSPKPANVIFSFKTKVSINQANLIKYDINFFVSLIDRNGHKSFNSNKKMEIRKIISKGLNLTNQ